MTGLIPVNLQAIADELHSLAVNLHCCIQDLSDQQSLFLMQRVKDQTQRIRATIPTPLMLADCDLLARTELADVLDWLDAVEPKLPHIKPPFRVEGGLGVLYTWASNIVMHADRAARRKSAVPPFTELARQELQQKYGATEYLRRRWADEPDDAAARINSGIEEALLRFPELKSWTPDDWSCLFFCSRETVTQTAAWRALESAKIHHIPEMQAVRDLQREGSMQLITDPVLRSDTLWLALDRVMREIHEDKRILFTKEPASEQGCNSELINRLTAEAGLSKWPVFEVRELVQAKVKTDRWLKVNHPEVDEPVEFAIWRLHGHVDMPDAKIARLLNYLMTWRDRRASQLQSTAAMSQHSSSTKRFRVALSFPGERREFVSRVADILAARLGREHILYDYFYEAEFARPNLDVYLQNLYHAESDLICVFLCAEYEKKDWCGLEWRAIRDVIKSRRESDVMPFRFDATKIPGLFSIDGYVWIDKREPNEIAELILQRLGKSESHHAPQLAGTCNSVLVETPTTVEIDERFTDYRQSRIQAIKQGQTPLQLEDTPKLVCHMIPGRPFGNRAKFTIPQLQEQLSNFPLLVLAGSKSSKTTIEGLLISESAHHTNSEFGYTEVRKSGIIEAVASQATTRNRLIRESLPHFSHDLVKETVRSVRSYLKAYAELGVESPVFCFLSLVGVRGMMLYWPGFGRTAHPVDCDDILIEPIVCNDLLLDDCTELLRPAFDTIWNAGGLDYCPLFNKPS